MKSLLDKKISLIVILISISIGSLMFFTQSYSQYAFGFEEDFLVFQTGIISTDDQDYAISKDFETRIIQDGKIMRLSGITTTGEVYYLYQKMVDEEIIVKGKILVNKVFVPIKYKVKIFEPKIPAKPETQLIISAKLPQYTYAGYPFAISVKVFDAEKNPQAKFEQGEGTLENVFVNVTITNQFDKYVTSFNGKTDFTGLFRGSYVVRENITPPGKYNVNVVVDDGTNAISQSFTTFFRGDIRYYFDNNP
ncbi:MAG: hypothetical protein ACREAK_01525 [Nitrosarchaeum sp.]